MLGILMSFFKVSVQSEIFSYTLDATTGLAKEENSLWNNITN